MGQFEYSNCRYNIIKIPARGYCPECISWNIPTAYKTLGYQSELIVQNVPVGILSIKIRTEATWNISNATEAGLNIPIAYITDFIVQNGLIGIFSLRILTEVTWNILTTTVASWNIPTAYLALSCESEFILTKVTWIISTISQTVPTAI